MFVTTGVIQTSSTAMISVDIGNNNRHLFVWNQLI